MPTIDIHCHNVNFEFVQPIVTCCKPQTKKMGDSNNSCVCLYRSLKLLTDDQVFAAV